MKYSIRWAKLQGPTADDLNALWHDLANALVTLAVLFGTVAWVIAAVFSAA